ncbi:MAG: FliM/FliN family flagellar motor switch protein, partial [Thermodesulfobacteriota bacterium]|nr:FliM/FliN family flagellar motor switch protein [Thermodesulfobacteriota bacterium]
EPIRSKLYAGFQSDQLEVDHEWIKRFIAQVRQAEVEISVELGRTKISGRHLLALKQGDVIPLEQDVSAPLVAKVEGVPKFQGYAGVTRGNQAFQISGEIRNQ